MTADEFIPIMDHLNNHCRQIHRDPMLVVYWIGAKFFSLTRQEFEVALQPMDIGILPVVVANGRYAPQTENLIPESAQFGTVSHKFGATPARHAHGGAGRALICTHAKTMSSLVVGPRGRAYDIIICGVSVQEIDYAIHVDDDTVSMRSDQAQAFQRIICRPRILGYKALLFDIEVKGRPLASIDVLGHVLRGRMVDFIPTLDRHPEARQPYRFELPNRQRTGQFHGRSIQHASFNSPLIIVHDLLCAVGWLGFGPRNDAVNNWLAGSSLDTLALHNDAISAAICNDIAPGQFQPIFANNIMAMATPTVNDQFAYRHDVRESACSWATFNAYAQGHVFVNVGQAKRPLTHWTGMGHQSVASLIVVDGGVFPDGGDIVIIDDWLARTRSQYKAALTHIASRCS